MTENPIADRYAGTLFELAKSTGRLEDALLQLRQLGELMHEYKPLCQLLLNPDVEVADKLRVLDRTVADGWLPELRAFLQLVLSMGRAEALGDIVEAFRELVDAEQGRVRVLVRSAHPLPVSLKHRLKARLQLIEQRDVELTEETDPTLIGGIQVLFDRRMFDGSLKTRLSELRQQLKRVRVH